MAERKVFVVGMKEAQERIDRILPMLEPSWTRSQVQAWINAGRVSVDGVKVKSSQRFRSGVKIAIEIPPTLPSRLQPEHLKLDIRYEDADILIVNKEAGMVVHPSPGHGHGTLVNALLAHCGDSLLGVGGEYRPGIVHRLDKDTSGLMVVAKHDTSHRILAEQIRNRQVKREYLALVQGSMGQDKGKIAVPLGRDPWNRQRFCVLSRGKHAVTHFYVVRRLEGATLVCCQLETGRTHQIRVHLRYIGFPIIGDPVYGPRKNDPHLSGQALHSSKLGFRHPRTGNWLEIYAELPPSFQHALTQPR